MSIRASVELGSIDGSVSGNNFTATTFLDYLASIKLTWAMISVPPAVLADEAALRQIRDHADRLGIKLQLAHGSVCPSSRSFNAQLGTVEEQVARALKASQIFGASCMRCVLGGDPERPQIEMHIDNMVKAIRAIRSRILDAGVKLAVENHGGDLQAREMKMMIEAVGPDVMGVCLDSGNPVWMLEDPHMTLETLIPYAATCHVRDSAVWKVPEGIAVRWVNMGDGNVDIDGWIKKFIQAKPGMPIIFENLVSGNPRVHAIYDPKFWDNWRKMPASEFSRFVAIADNGRPKPAVPRPANKTAGQQRIDDLEVCVRYTRELLQRI
jgi:3-oxoisoapionate decarboxylase